MTQISTRQYISSLYERPVIHEDQLVKTSYGSREPRRLDEYSSLSHSDRQDEGSGWQQSQPRFLNSENKKVLYKDLRSQSREMYQTTSEPTRNPPREQLPPLSSLFGSTSHPNPSAQSPYSDRNSPIFTATSPLDTRHPITPGHLDRPYDPQYFQRPSTSRQFSYTSTSESTERVGLKPPQHPNHPGTRPESPRYETQYDSSSTSRSNLPASTTNGWSAPHPRLEHFPRDTSSSFRPHSEQRPAPPPLVHRTEQDPRPSYRTPPTPTYPTSPASTITGDNTTTKDGLGPKIWTGTQFLPRFVRQAEVPGEGMCYFYDDGTHCKTVIDGEIVNAHWGVTKAGKPRKRLAIACITCREKKIKCDPDYPRCIQCEKFGRVCKFKNAPRGGQGSPDAAPAEAEDVAPRIQPSRKEGESLKVERRDGSRSVSPRSHKPPVSATSPSKRQRTSYNEFTSVALEESPKLVALESTSPSTKSVESASTNPIDHKLLREWQTSPLITQHALVNDLIPLFFSHMPETGSCMFPEGQFQSWLYSSSEKSLDDLMLIYTILAFASVFSPKPEHKARGAQFAIISRYACDTRHYTIQLVQSRLILTLYYFAVNNVNDSWDFCGAAIGAATVLKLNVELEKSRCANLTVFPYGLTRAGFAECWRRTFWTCYLLSGFTGYSSGRLSAIHPDDIFLRLPCDTKNFEAQATFENPLFDPSTLSIQYTGTTVGSMAYLVSVYTVWEEVMVNISRTSQRPMLATSDSAFKAFHERTTKRLIQWKNSLPQCYQISIESLKRAADNGKLDTLITMHAVCHGAAIKLNRYVQKSNLTREELNQYIASARLHAEELLFMTDTLARYRSMLSPRVAKNSANTTKLTSPFIGYAIVSATDVLTAKFKLATVSSRIASLTNARTVLAELAPFWLSARNQVGLVSKRVEELASLTSTGTRTTIGSLNASGDFEMKDAIEKIASKDYDTFYV